tara:strand:- start:730 stop:1410 length:681 start_codon:yes stop_codon:yes gene_type:complete
MSSSYFNIRKGLEDFIPNSGYDFSSSPNVFGMDIGNMTSFGTTLGIPKQGNILQQFGEYLAPSWQNSANPSVRSGQLKESGQSKWLGNYIKSGGTLSNESGEDTILGELKKKAETKTDTTSSVDDGVLTEHEKKLAINAAEHEHNLDLQKKYLEQTGTQLKDLSQFQFLLGQMSKLPDRMSLGNMMRADAYKNQGDRSVTSNIGLMNNMGLPGGLAQFSYDFQRFG